MSRIIFCDCDGTLVGSQIVVSEVNKEAIRKWEEKGNLFSVATGRQYAGLVQSLSKELNLTSPQITNAGADIIDPLTDKPLFSVTFEDSEIRAYIEILQKEKIPFWIEQHNSVYIYDEERRHEAFYEAFGTLPQKPFAGLELKDLAKMGVFPIEDPLKREIIENNVRNYPSLRVLRLATAFGEHWDVQPAAATKHTGVLRVTARLNFQRDQTIGIGDGINDFPLMEACGYKIAMGNAMDDLKAIADYVTTSSEEDGVAKAIYHLLEMDEKSE